MEGGQSPDEIRRAATILDNAIEGKDVDSILGCFSEDCEIELLGIRLTGKEGVRKWLNWLYGYLDKIAFMPITIVVSENTFVEEFTAQAVTPDGREITSRQAEVLVYEDYKVKSLRLYFDRLDFAESVAKGFLSKALVRRMIKRSLRGLD